MTKPRRSTVTPAPAAHDQRAVLTRLLAPRRTVVMGILNVTPDSFSDGGCFVEPDIAIDHARRMIAEGADVVDIGAESSRPYGGAAPVSFDEELARLSAVLPAVVALGALVSIDTMKARIAAWALDHGVAMVNDVWGLQRDPDIARVVADHSAPVVIMHNRMAADPTIDIMADVEAFLARSIDIADKAGIVRDNIVLDPGVGFGKTPEQSMIVIAQLGRLKRFGLPLLVGASRKRFISTVSPSEPQQRIGGSIAAHLAAVANGAAIVRTHDVAETLQALKVAAAVQDKR